MDLPSYGELIDFLNVAKVAKKPEETITQMFTLKYPYVPINQPVRFLDTVRRVAAPTRPSTLGRQKFWEVV